MLEIMKAGITDNVSLGNILTILSVLYSGWQLNNSFVAKLTQIETKVDAMWKKYTEDHNE